MKKKPVTREKYKGDKVWAVVYTKPNPDDKESSILEVAYKNNSLMKAEFFVERRWNRDKEDGWINYSVEEVEKGRRHNCFKELHKKVMKCTDCFEDITGAYYWNGIAYCGRCFHYARENQTQQAMVS